LDTNKMFNTQQYQANYVDQLYDAGSIVGNQAIKDALWPMFGAERAVNRVEPYEVIGAVQVSRKLNNPGSVLEGGTFLCLKFSENAKPDGTVPQARASLRTGAGYAGALGQDAVAMINKYISEKKSLKMPSQTQEIPAKYRSGATKPPSEAPPLPPSQ